MLQQRDLTRSFFSNLSSSKDPTVTHCYTFLSRASLCRGAASQSGRFSSSCAFCMNVPWTLTVPCVHICPGVPSSVAVPALGQRTRTGPTNPHVLDSGAKLQIRLCLLFLCPFLKSETLGLVAGAYPMSCPEQNWHMRTGAGSKGIRRKLSMTQGPLCGTWFISSVQSWSGRTQACLGVFVHPSFFGGFVILAEV